MGIEAPHAAASAHVHAAEGSNGQQHVVANINPPGSQKEQLRRVEDLEAVKLHGGLSEAPSQQRINEKGECI